MNVIFCLVVSYCAKFPGSGMGTPVVVCRRKEVWSNDEIEFLCKIYLPRNSPLYQPIKVSEQSHYCYGQLRDWAFFDDTARFSLRRGQLDFTRSFFVLNFFIRKMFPLTV